MKNGEMDCHKIKQETMTDYLYALNWLNYYNLFFYESI